MALRPWHLALLTCALTAWLCASHVLRMLAQGSSGCLMTWMRPEYAEVPGVAHARGRYRLLRYSEAGWKPPEGELLEGRG